MGNKTPLYDHHQKAGAKIVDFAGWDMPLHYGSQLEEHNHVRQNAGVFDVSHMTIVDVVGEQSKDFLRYLLANDVAKLKEPGKAIYSCMLNESGGVIDDLITYYLAPNRYRLIVNSATREKDLAWIEKQSARFDVKFTPRTDQSILAVQGPNAIEKVRSIFSNGVYERICSLKPFEVMEYDDACVARTGYTGEDGIEAMLPSEVAKDAWDKLLAAGVKPCGLGARDTLRLEAGMNLYGTDMDETTSPLESNLGWTVAWEPAERDFIGRAALTAQKAKTTQRMVGLVLSERGVLRNHLKVIIPGVGEGEITSGSFSPTLQQAIALARVPTDIGEHCFVDIRGKQVPAKVVKPPFVRKGQSVL
ncbi:MAG: gcvT [Gammaproteobacteria bacterium]|jgi:aminomethyltransferase|nr:gcvT [Gammaproteobacteria bacterium]